MASYKCIPKFHYVLVVLHAALYTESCRSCAGGAGDAAIPTFKLRACLVKFLPDRA